MNAIKSTLFTFLLVTTLALSACTPSPAPVLNRLGTPPPTPQAGKAVVIGQVIDASSRQPLANVVIRLAEVHREGEGGIFVLNTSTSPGTRSDEQGYFVFVDIPAGEYVVAVGEGDNLNDYDVIEEGQSGRAKIWTAASDQVNDWGVIPVEVLFR